MIEIEKVFKIIINKLKETIISVAKIVIPIAAIFMFLMSTANKTIYKDLRLEEGQLEQYSIYKYKTLFSDTKGIEIDKNDIIQQELQNKGFSKEWIEQKTEEEIIEILDMTNKLGKKVTNINNCNISELLWCLVDNYDEKLDSPEQLQYLLDAGLITQYPKIDNFNGQGLNGIVKFKRLFENQEINLHYINNTLFQQKFNQYKTVANKDIFNYFTVDEEGNIVIVDSKGKFKINYKSILQPHTLPFEFLWSLLITGESYEFVESLAKKAYETEIIVGIYGEENPIADVIYANSWCGEIETKYVKSDDKKTYQKINVKVNNSNNSFIELLLVDEVMYNNLRNELRNLNLQQRLEGYETTVNMVDITLFLLDKAEDIKNTKQNIQYDDIWTGIEF